MSSRRATPLVPVLLGLLAVLVLAGCSSLPASGPIVDADAASMVDGTKAPDINAVPPSDNATGVEIVSGFLDAMTASPTRIDVAKQYLSSSAAEAWDPEAATIIYADKLPPSDEVTRVTVPLVDADRIGRSGAWEGELSSTQQDLRLDLTIEDGEYRITNPPDALVVPLPWFNQRYRPTSLYFFDPTGRILVPEPVYLPRGEQLATSLISGLLSGPAGREDVTRSFLPGGLTLRLSVPVSPDGVADIQLDGSPTALSPATVERMLAQLAWTLRQEPMISSFRVTIGEVVVQVPDGGSQFSVDDAASYDPAVDGASTDIYGLRSGMLVVRSGNQLRNLAGPFGAPGAGLRSAAVNLDATRAVGVGLDGTTLLGAPIDDGAARRQRLVTEVFSGGVDLLPPAWDFADRIWLVDDTSDGAVVRVIERGRVRQITVPLVTGETVKSFLVSRDATRFAAVVKGREGDQLRIGRIEVNDRGEPSRIAATEALVTDPGLSLRIADIAWTSPTSIAVLTPVVPRESFEVRTVSVDGSPSSSDGFSTTVSGRLIGLVGSEASELPTYGATPARLLDLFADEAYGFVGEPPTGLRYAG